MRLKDLLKRIFDEFNIILLLYNPSDGLVPNKAFRGTKAQ